MSAYQPGLIIDGLLDINEIDGWKPIVEAFDMYAMRRSVTGAFLSFDQPGILGAFFIGFRSSLNQLAPEPPSHISVALTARLMCWYFTFLFTYCE